MKAKTTIGQRCAAILRRLGIKPEGITYAETAKIITRAATLSQDSQ